MRDFTSARLVRPSTFVDLKRIRSSSVSRLAKSPYRPSLSGRLYSAMNFEYLLGLVGRDGLQLGKNLLDAGGRMLVSTRFCCRISRLTLSGRSSLSMMPRTKRRYCGRSSLASSMMKTRLT